MINFICGLLAIITFTLFVGGLGYSIWESTGFFAFPVIVAIVLTMAYAGFIGELKSGTDYT
jgi:ABC-type nitrate/sulfonate/bicarbonate transport system permease component